MSLRWQGEIEGVKEKKGMRKTALCTSDWHGLFIWGAAPWWHTESLSHNATVLPKPPPVKMSQMSYFLLISIWLMTWI